ncbi:hypothetical protein IEI94_01195 [Halomonas sp. ML-15]|uniref:outer membrane beta-barrel protein n=1 Tax=Halomonas sp. ML-15 TaxID=2773305 RepID=UPI0017460EC8|nr:outer membrane beta-barrel protein [Halomonas sp. ML-15]MBD3894470.1 hypothetical protein [Halomonas sp. ML-15]
MNSSLHRLSRYALIPAMALAMGAALADEDAIPHHVNGDFTELAILDNGVVLEGAEMAMPDGATSGFRLLAGYMLPKMPNLGIGAEITYLVTDEAPTAIDNQPVLLNTTSLQGAVTAGLHLGRFSLFAKSGLTDWSGDLETTLAGSDSQEMDMAMGGTAQVHGFGARMNFTPRTVAHLQYERIDAPRLEHLNLTTAMIAYHF